MALQDKAKLISTMDPERIAALLMHMDPHEAVAVLAALGNTTEAAVSAILSEEERRRLMKVSRAANCKFWCRNASCNEVKLNLKRAICKRHATATTVPWA